MQGKIETERKVSPFSFYYLGAAGVFCVVFVALYRSTAWQPWIVYLSAINASAFSVFSFDKGAAKAGSMRVPELVIFLLALLGGTPAVLLSTHLLKHKTRKAKFQMVIVLILFAQIAVVFGLLNR